MSPEQTMFPTRRRPIPGMTGEPLARPRRDSAPDDTPCEGSIVGVGDQMHGPPADVDTRSRASLADTDESERLNAPADPRPARRPAADYGTTRLVNFRIPVDLHDRFRDLVRETEARHRKLRKPSLTELVIALLEEGPQTADEVAEMIRRKRAAEHEER